MWESVWLLVGTALLLLLVIPSSHCDYNILPSAVNCGDYYDMVIPVGPLDRKFVVQVLPSLFRHVEGLRNIYLVGDNLPRLDNPRVHSVSEACYPFAHQDAVKSGIRADRTGWYLQQLYKLYAARAIPELTPNYLVWDADTFLLTPQRFFLKGTPIGRFGLGQQYHLPYFQHMAQLHPDLQRQRDDLSGICNFMPFHTPFLEDLIQWVENHHHGQRSFWQLFLDAVNPTIDSGASEFEIYFNFMWLHHHEALQLMDPPLRLDNFRKQVPSEAEFATPQVDVVSVHWYQRGVRA